MEMYYPAPGTIVCASTRVFTFLSARTCAPQNGHVGERPNCSPASGHRWARIVVALHMCVGALFSTVIMGMGLRALAFNPVHTGEGGAAIRYRSRAPSIHTISRGPRDSADYGDTAVVNARDSGVASPPQGSSANRSVKPKSNRSSASSPTLQLPAGPQVNSRSTGSQEANAVNPMYLLLPPSREEAQFKFK